MMERRRLSDLALRRRQLETGRSDRWIRRVHEPRPRRRRRNARQGMPELFTVIFNSDLQTHFKRNVGRILLKGDNITLIQQAPQ